MSWEANFWIFKLITPANYITLTPILRPQYFFSFYLIVVTIWPTKIIPFFYFNKFLRGQHCALPSSILLRPQTKKVISTMNNCIQTFVFKIPIKCDYTSYASGIFYSITLSLVKLIFIKLPNSCVILKLWTWVNTWRKWGSFWIYTCI